MAIAEIGSYILELIAGDQAASIRARITLRDAKNNDMGVLCFVEGVKPPAAVIGAGVPIGYYPVACYGDMVDLLRNECPVYVTTNNQNTLTVTTNSEKVGEGEEAGGGLALSPFVLKRST